MGKDCARNGDGTVFHRIAAIRRSISWKRSFLTVQTRFGLYYDECLGSVISLHDARAPRLMLAARFTGLITAVNNTAVCIDESTGNEGTLTGQ